jgi:tRNA-specific 2-thiouridylase
VEKERNNIKTPRRARGKKVFVGMSGGVDSSVAAYLLKKQGYDVIGVHLRCWNEKGCDDKEADDARSVAKKLNIPFYLFDTEDEYKKRVFKYMLDGYKRGITPNPDVMCNKEIKFGVFLEKVLELGGDYVATGHYVKIKKSDGRYYLYEAKDKNKDQSYFLWTLTQNKLERCLFPIGDYAKSEVREIARKAGLPAAEKKDSQGICFVGKVMFKEFLKKYISPKRGNILSTSGKVMGTHDGAYFYTIGQRHGVGISKGGPYYVADKNTDFNTIVLANINDLALYKKEIIVSDINLIGIDKLPKDVFVRIRYRQEKRKAKINSIRDSIKVVFKDKQAFIAPGQSAVFYSKVGQMLGGGIIR